MPIKRWSRSPRSSALESCRAIYTAAFSQPPYCEDPSGGERFVERVKKYSKRPGFALDVATSAGLPVGFALSVVAEPGDWWRDRVAEFVGPARGAQWLGSACREIVHVAVSPDHQRQGHGKTLIDHVLRSAGAPTAVLSCHPDAIAAQRLYLSTGFTVIGENFTTGPGQRGFWVMAAVCGTSG